MDTGAVRKKSSPEGPSSILYSRIPSRQPSCIRTHTHVHMCAHTYSTGLCMYLPSYIQVTTAKTPSFSSDVSNVWMYMATITWVSPFLLRGEFNKYDIYFLKHEVGMNSTGVKQALMSLDSLIKIPYTRKLHLSHKVPFRKLPPGCRSFVGP